MSYFPDPTNYSKDKIKVVLDLCHEKYRQTLY